MSRNAADPGHGSAPDPGGSVPGTIEADVISAQGRPIMVARRKTRPTPIMISPIARNLWLLAALVALVLLCREVPAIVTITLGGVFLALLLSFPVRLLSMMMPRGLAILTVMVSLIVMLVFGFLAGVPLLIGQLQNLIEAIPTLAADAESLIREIVTPLQERGLVSGDADSVIADIQAGAVTSAEQIAEGLLTNLLNSIGTIFNTAIIIFAIVFVATYLLVDFRRIKASYIRMAPRRYRTDAVALWEGFGHSLSRYLAGLFLSLAVQGLLSGIALWLLDVPYAFLLGLWVSLTAIIPYLGAFLGAAPAVLLGFFESPTTGFIVIGLYVVIQQLESNLLTPRIQGQAVRVHPIIVLLAVIAGTELFGLRGAVFAVPTVAVARVIFDFLVARVQVSGTDVPVIAIRSFQPGEGHKEHSDALDLAQDTIDQGRSTQSLTEPGRPVP
ncbi:MAG TPA: AI-2E family transporter [Thermomicrobiales bacterium]|nr:AI-2E family transporter [Thermomicrobiales bacterium]